MGRHGIGKTNSKGCHLLSQCSQHHLAITNTIFKIKDIYKGTWKHPQLGEWHMLDYVMVRQQDRCYMKLTRAMRGAECWTDHRLVRSSMSFCVRPPARKVPAKKKLNCPYLRTENTRASLTGAISQALTRAPRPQEFDDLVEDSWKHLVDTLTIVLEEVLGFISWKNRDWFDENIDGIRKMLAAKNKAHQDSEKSFLGVSET